MQIDLDVEERKILTQLLTNTNAPIDAAHVLIKLRLKIMGEEGKTKGVVDPSHSTGSPKPSQQEQAKPQPKHS